MPAQRAIIIEIDELGLDHSHAWTAQDFQERRHGQFNRLERHHEWRVLARGSSKLTKTGEVVNTSHHVETEIDG